LHYALALSAPEVLLEIAKTRGFNISPEDLEATIGDDETSGFALRREFSTNLVPHKALTTPFWGRINIGGDIRSGFVLTIPGPSFVQVMGNEPSSDETTEEDRPSAVDLYETL